MAAGGHRDRGCGLVIAPAVGLPQSTGPPAGQAGGGGLAPPDAGAILQQPSRGSSRNFSSAPELGQRPPVTHPGGRCPDRPHDGYLPVD